MISELKIRNFKSLESVDLKLGHFNLLVGANASGKSNLLDALRFLQGVGKGLRLDQILDDKPQSVTTPGWPGIRGGPKLVAFRKPDGSHAREIELSATLEDMQSPSDLGSGLTYKLACSTIDDDPSFTVESLYRGEELVAEVNRAQAAKELHPGMDTTLLDFWKMSTLLMWTYQPIEEISKDASYISASLADMQFLDLLPDSLKIYSSKVRRIGEHGEGFAGLIREIESNGSKPALLEWLKELRPDEVSDLYALPGADDDFMVATKEGNLEFRASALSEGTLRFIALAAAFFQPSMPKVLVIEEIEKGLHPSRLRLLLDLMRSQSKRTGTQVFATTHSPTLLAWLTEEDRKTTFVCTRDAESGATKMRSLAEIPRFEELLEEGSHIDELFAEGWLESAPQ